MLGPRCSRSRRRYSSWRRSNRGPKWGREGWYVSAPENRRLSRNGGHRSIEEDETKNIWLTGLAKRTSVFGCVIPQGKGTWRTIALPDCGLGSESALSGEADGAERRRERRRSGHEQEKRGKEQNLYTNLLGITPSW